MLQSNYLKGGLGEIVSLYEVMQCGFRIHFQVSNAELMRLDDVLVEEIEKN